MGSQRDRLDIDLLKERVNQLEKKLEERQEPLDMVSTKTVSDEVDIPRYAVRHKSSRWFDVVDMETGKTLNAKSLTKDQAEKLRNELFHRVQIPSMGGYANVRHEGDDVPD